MSEFRIIPILLLKGSGFVKTTRFKKPIYLGDSLNIVKLLNDKEADELTILNIGNHDDNGINYRLLAKLASECFMPLSYGGGIDSLDSASRILGSGYEKIILNTKLNSQKLVESIVGKFGSSSTVACVDVRKNWMGQYIPYSSNGRRKVSKELLQYVKELQSMGIGEIILQSIDRDGTYTGYDYKLINEIATQIDIPLVACGGAGDIQDFRLAINSGASAVAAGSLFSFKAKGQGVLINYPTREIVKKLFHN